MMIRSKKMTKFWLIKLPDKSEADIDASWGRNLRFFL